MEYQKSDENYSALNENLKILKRSRNHLGKQKQQNNSKKFREKTI